MRSLETAKRYTHYEEAVSKYTSCTYAGLQSLRAVSNPSYLEIFHTFDAFDTFDTIDVPNV